jgi:predicted nucleic acid-binding protein
MDVCCLNRPFDDLSQDRVYLEAEAILSIISRCEQGEWTLIASGVIEYELSNSTDENRLGQVMDIYAAASERVTLTEQATSRAVFLQQNGVKEFDSFHVALAEVNGADVFLTTDDRLLRAAKRLNVKIKTANPVSWLMEVLKDGQ